MNRLLLFRATAANSGSTGATIFGVDMSIFRRFINHGRELIRYHLQVYCHPGKSGNLNVPYQLDPLVVRTGRAGGKSLPRINPTNKQPQQQNSLVQWIGQEVHAQVRQIFVNNVLNRVTNSLSVDLRRKAQQQLLHANNSRPFFALVGVSLASGAGMLTKENEFNGIIHEIKESLAKKQEQIKERSPNPQIISPMEAEAELSVENLEFGPLIAKGCSAAVYSARWKLPGEQSESSNQSGSELFPLAVKMMFNFYCESNSFAIVRAMSKEIVPARRVPQLEGIGKEDLENLKMCPPHPNIIEITHVFTDMLPMLPESMQYADALPRRLNLDGLGRNMTLFLLMKRYTCNLNFYLRQHGDLKLKNRLLILVQLLEGVEHLTRNEIAHRDLKSDNILLDVSAEAGYPQLVITDFGCCLASKTNGLLLPFPTDETDRGGAAATMAPEVSTAKPGTWRKISYEKSDAWSCGTISFEIFGAQNPFASRLLDSQTYDDSQLPLIETVPPVINALVHGLLKRAASERLSAELAATVCHIALFAPTRWLQIDDSETISDSEIMQWLLTLTTKLLCQQPSETLKLEFIVIRTFLQRVRFSTVRAALDWIHRISIRT